MSSSAHGARTPLVTLAAVMVWTGIQLDSLEVSAQAIHNRNECRARIGRVGKRRRCVACVRRANRVFHKQGGGHGFCRTRAVAPAPGIIRGAAGCRARIGRIGKRKRCISCVHRGGVFHKRGAGAGFCHGGAAVDQIRAAAGCRARVGRIGKRKRCISCVHRGGVFHRQGAPQPGILQPAGAAVGFCRGALPAGQLRNGAGCVARVMRIPKRKRCLVCVNRGGTFHQQGAAAGFCRGGAPLVNKGVVVTNAPGCVTHIGRAKKRRRCRACVIRGGVFHRQGGAAGFCRTHAPRPPAAGPIRHAAGCRSRIGRPVKRSRCITCVHRGGAFHKRGSSAGFCAGPVAPKPRPGVLRTVHQCRTAIGRHSKKRRCIACVRRGGRFHRQGAAHGFCR